MGENDDILELTEIVEDAEEEGVEEEAIREAFEADEFFSNLEETDGASVSLESLDSTADTSTEDGEEIEALTELVEILEEGNLQPAVSGKASSSAEDRSGKVDIDPFDGFDAALGEQRESGKNQGAGGLSESEDDEFEGLGDFKLDVPFLKEESTAPPEVSGPSKRPADSIEPAVIEAAVERAVREVLPSIAEKVLAGTLEKVLKEEISRLEKRIRELQK